MMTESARPAPLLIFDLDGTLYRTDSSFLATMRRVYADHELRHPGDAAVLAMVGETFETFLDWLAAQGFTQDRAALRGEIGRIEMEEIRRHGALYDGVAETLRELADRGCVLTLCTNGDRRYVDAVLERGEIADAFSELSTLEPGSGTKPERVGGIVRSYAGRLPIVIGDRYHDVEAARANGCRMVGASYGYARDGELASADACIRSFDELPGVVTRLAGKPTIAQET